MTRVALLGSRAPLDNSTYEYFYFTRVTSPGSICCALMVPKVLLQGPGSEYWVEICETVSGFRLVGYIVSSPRTALRRSPDRQHRAVK